MSQQVPSKVSFCPVLSLSLKLLPFQPKSGVWQSEDRLPFAQEVSKLLCERPEEFGPSVLGVFGSLANHAGKAAFRKVSDEQILRGWNIKGWISGWNSHNNHNIFQWNLNESTTSLWVHYDHYGFQHHSSPGLRRWWNTSVISMDWMARKPTLQRLLVNNSKAWLFSFGLDRLTWQEHSMRW